MTANLQQLSQRRFFRGKTLMQMPTLGLVTLMIVGICGSPREQATDFILKEALKMLEAKGFTTKFWSVRGKRLGFCTHCDFCLKNKVCAFKDDMQELYALLKDAEGIVFAISSLQRWSQRPNQNHHGPLQSSSC